MTAAMRITLLAVAAMAVLSTASAATYNVGEGAWDLQTNYATWASSKKFLVGDSIVFTYSSAAHDVLEVSKADYDSCNAATPMTTFNTGSDTINLPAAGTRYFICGFGTHCNNGMKVTIDVGSGSSTSPPAPASGPSANNSPPSPPAPASVPGAGNSPPPPKTPSAATTVRATAGLGLVVLLAGLMA